MKQIICQFLDNDLVQLEKDHELSLSQKINVLSEKVKCLKQIQYVFEVDGKCKASSSACQSNLFKLPNYSQLNELNVEKQTNRIVSGLNLVISTSNRNEFKHQQVSSMTSQSTLQSLSSQAVNLSFYGSELGALANRGQTISENSFSQDSDFEGDLSSDEKMEVMMHPITVAKNNVWQRKHNRYIMDVLQMRPNAKQHHHHHHHHHHNVTNTN